MIEVLSLLVGLAIGWVGAFIVLGPVMSFLDRHFPE